MNNEELLQRIEKLEFEVKHLRQARDAALRDSLNFSEHYTNAMNAFADHIKDHCEYCNNTDEKIYQLMDKVFPENAKYLNDIDDALKPPPKPKG